MAIADSNCHSTKLGSEKCDSQKPRRPTARHSAATGVLVASVQAPGTKPRHFRGRSSAPWRIARPESVELTGNISTGAVYFLRTSRNY